MAQAGVWHGVFATLAGDTDFEEVFIDSTIVRAHQHAAGAPKKRAIRPSGVLEEGSVRRFTRWLTAWVCLQNSDSLVGRPGDSPEALPLLGELQPRSVAADRAYDTDALIAHLSSLDATAVIPSRCNRREQRALDKDLYRSRNLVERFFARIKEFRRIATRYEKLSERFASFVAVTASFIWLV
ncbi:IS5 family transposase [Burkholderia multivorans]|uniref:IS5 family transposase n=1 Tax=Burkholderia multivorans TaxID=87883 RepID=UPI0020B19706|nr:IS5 family transposase [Burkholderia multivorans]